MFVVKCGRRQSNFIRDKKPLVFASPEELSIKCTKCFLPSCVAMRPLLHERGKDLCKICRKDGFNAWFCTDHDNHFEDYSECSHASSISSKFTISDFLRQNQQICHEIAIVTEGDLAEIACICIEKGWSPKDIMGDLFFPAQNRHKLSLHFIGRNDLVLSHFLEGTSCF